MTPLTIPNALTLLRILAVPFFAIAVWYNHLWEALAIFVAAGLTDLLDGWIARRFNQGSDLGAILDPAADKLLMTTAFILMALPKDHLKMPIPTWVAILSISRDVVISFLALLSLVKHIGLNRRPSLLGKFTTGAQIVSLGVGLLANAQGPQPWQRFALPWVYYVMAGLVLASGIHYYFRGSVEVETHMSDEPRPRRALEELFGSLPLRFGAIFLGLIVALWLLRQALMPFFVAMVLAYLLGPLVERLAQRVRRSFAVASVLFAALALVAAALVLVLPFLSDQFAKLYSSLPLWQELLMKKLGPVIQAHPAWAEKARGAMDALDPAAAFKGLLQAGSGLLGFVMTAVTLILVPLILYHLLLDGPRMLASLESLVPPRFQGRIRGMVSEIHERLGGFIRGQIAVAFTMALLQGLALTFLGVPYGWLLGILAGLFTVIPYSSYLVGLAPAVVLEMLQGASGTRVWMVALTFAAVQAVEGLYLTPVWVGRASKLHPLEVLLALVAFGHWFGLLGLLFAVPLMVTVKVVFRVLLDDYRQHPWFTETE